MTQSVIESNRMFHGNTDNLQAQISGVFLTDNYSWFLQEEAKKPDKIYGVLRKESGE